MSALKAMVNTPEGKVVLKCWQEDYVYPTAIADTPERTYYNLGQREFVLGLISLLENPEQLKDISTED